MSNLLPFPKNKRESHSGSGGNGDGGDNGGMELNQRVANLETGMAEVKTRLGGVEQRLDGVEQRLDGVERRLDRVEVKLEHIDREVSSFKWWVLAQIITALLTVIGTGIAIQQMTVATFQAAAQQPAPAAPVTQQPPIIINVPPAATAKQ